MQLKSLSIEGFRGFKDRQEIIFPENGEPLVLVGVNGAGKTAVLEAIRLGLESFHKEITIRPDLKGDFYFTELPYIANDFISSIHYDLKEAKVELSWSYPIEDPNALFYNEERLVKLSANSCEGYSKGEFKNLVERISDGLYFGEYSLALMLYYPSDRLLLSGNSSDEEEMMYLHDHQLSALKGALEPSINFDIFFDWFRKTEDIENEWRLTEDATFTNPSLKAVRLAIMSMLDGFTDVRIQRYPILDMVVKKNGKRLYFRQLSSGEKALLTLAGDLAMRLALANPGLKSPLEGRGVVMIDEIDLHLHPRWQVDVLDRLRRTFPNIQFILTTHSPLIINRLPAESLYYLDNQQCFAAKDAPEQFRSYGANIAKILSWQGVEHILPQAVTEAINEIGMLIQDDEIEAAKAALNELKSKIDPNHPDLVNLETDLELKEIEDEVD